MIQALGTACCFGFAAAVGSTFGRSAANAFINKDNRYITKSNYYDKPKRHVNFDRICLDCGSVRTIQDGNQRLGTPGEENTASVPECQGHFGLGEDLERRRRSGTGDRIRSQVSKDRKVR